MHAVICCEHEEISLQLLALHDAPSLSGFTPHTPFLPVPSQNPSRTERCSIPVLMVGSTFCIRISSSSGSSHLCGMITRTRLLQSTERPLSELLAHQRIHLRPPQAELRSRADLARWETLSATTANKWPTSWANMPSAVTLQTSVILAVMEAGSVQSCGHEASIC